MARGEDALELWLGGVGWDMECEARRMIIYDAETAANEAEELVEDARARGELAMARWSNEGWDGW